MAESYECNEAGRSRCNFARDERQVNPRPSSFSARARCVGQGGTKNGDIGVEEHATLTPIIRSC